MFKKFIVAIVIISTLLASTAVAFAGPGGEWDPMPWSITLTE